MFQLNKNFKKLSREDKISKPWNRNKKSSSFVSISRDRRDQMLKNKTITPPAGAYSTESTYLYLENKVRLAADVNYTQSQLVSKPISKTPDGRGKQTNSLTETPKTPVRNFIPKPYYQNTPNMDRMDISQARTFQSAPFSNHSRFRTRDLLLRKVEDKNNSNLGFYNKFKQTTSEFDFKPKRARTVQGFSDSKSENGDAHSQRSKSFAHLPKKDTATKSDLNMTGMTQGDKNELFGVEHVNDTHEFRSLSRNDREKALQPRKGYMSKIDQTPKFTGVTPRVTGLAFGRSISRNNSEQQLDSMKHFFGKNKVNSLQ